MVKPRAITHRTFRDVLVRELGQDGLFDTMIPEMDTFVTATNLRRPVTMHAPRSKAAQVIRTFAEELTERHNEHNVITKKSA
jgi:hypothetical protein